MRIRISAFPVILMLSATLLLSACESAEERAEEHYQNALTLIAEGDVDRAVVELRNVFELNDSHKNARLTMAELMKNQGNLRRAYSHYLRIAEQYPEELDARLNLSEIAFITSNWEEMERHGLKAEELAPEDAQVRAIAAARAYRKAVMAEASDDMRAAAQQAAALLEDLPESMILHSILVDDALSEGDFGRALTEIDWLIENDPSDPRYHQARLQALAQLGDAVAIEQQLLRMVETFPDDIPTQEMLIRFYLSRNDLDSTEKFLRERVVASAPDDPGPTVDLIRFLTETNNIDAARAEIEKAIAEREDPDRFRVIGASLDFNQGDRDKAIATMTSVLETAEPSGSTREMKVAFARMLMAMGNEVGARVQITEVLEEDPSQPEALKMQAAWLIAADKTDDAIAGLRTALDRVPEDAQAMTLMADAYARAGRSELANEYLGRAVDASGSAPGETLRYARVLIADERYRPAEDILIKALRLTPNDTGLLVALGQVYLLTEDFGRAQGVADALRRLGSVEARSAADQLEAERLNRQEGTSEAVAFLEQITSAADASLASKISLIRARIGTGDLEGALSLAQELHNDNPDDAAPMFVLAAVHAVAGDLDQARQIYRDMIVEDPTRPLVWLGLVRLEQRLGDREAAKAAVAEGLTHVPEDTQLLLTRALFLEQGGDIDGAIAIYEDLYERNSSSVVVANNLASLLTTYRDDEASLDRAWMIARRLRDTKVPAMQDTYGWIAYRRGKSEEALPYLEAAVEGVPAEPLARYHLGKNYMALDRPEDALEQFRKAVELAGPGDQRAQIEEARALVQTLQAAPAPQEN